MIWIILFLSLLLLTLTGFVFVVRRFTKFCFFQKLSHRKACLISGLLLSVLLTAIFLWSGVWNAMIVFIHLLVFLLISEICFFFIARLRKQPFRRYWAGPIAIGATICCLAAGYFYAHHIFRTAYIFHTEHEPGVPSFRIVGFTDSHVGTTFHGSRLLEYVNRMNEEQPDIVVIVGDFIDDDTSYEDMVTSCNALSQLKARYGVYFVFGNHDAGYYASHRGYGKEELIRNLLANNVTILEDEVVPVAGNIVLGGRRDAGQPDRMTMNELTDSIPDDKVTLILDHQPNDYNAEADAGVDLVISGHTHGGQFFPVNRAGEWIGANDMTYGTMLRDQTRFIVSSGIANWAFMFKTGCIAEYIVIDLSC